METLYTFKPVGESEIPDLVTLFESRGAPHYCWCSLWRKSKPKAKSGAQKRSCLLQDIHAGIQVGILAYDMGEPIGWCSVGPRDTFRKLGGDEDLVDVWSIVCFYVKRSHRKQGVAKRLLQEAIQLARTNKAKFLESYAAAADGTSYRFMGYVPMYEEANFVFTKMAGKRRHVMIKTL